MVSNCTDQLHEACPDPTNKGVWKSWSYGQSVISLLFLLPNPEILSKEGEGRNEKKDILRHVNVGHAEKGEIAIEP